MRLERKATTATSVRAGGDGVGDIWVLTQMVVPVVAVLVHDGGRLTGGWDGRQLGGNCDQLRSTAPEATAIHSSPPVFAPGDGGHATLSPTLGLSTAAWARWRSQWR